MSFDLEDTAQVLERTPRVVASLLEGLPEAWLDANEGPETFSPRDVVGHLIHGERTDWIPRLKLILERGEDVAFTPFDRFGFRGEIEGCSIDELLERFSLLRRENLSILRDLSLTPRELARKGRHPALGTVTLEQLLASWMVHDLGHVRQIVRVLARRYEGAVGPWREYLSILERR